MASAEKVSGRVAATGAFDLALNVAGDEAVDVVPEEGVDLGVTHLVIMPPPTEPRRLSCPQRTTSNCELLNQSAAGEGSGGSANGRPAYSALF